jgi:hypothetical protein
VRLQTIKKQEKQMNSSLTDRFKNRYFQKLRSFIQLYNIYVLVPLILILFFACSEIILEKDIKNKSIVLLSPKDSSTLKSLTPSFWWDEVEGARNYQIQIVSPTFENPVRLYVDSIVATNKFTMDLDTLQFQWRVRALNGGYQSSYTTATFKIDSGSVIEDRALKLLSPSNDSYFKNQDIELKWEAATDVEKYNLVVTGDTSIDINLSNTIISSKIKFGANKNFTWKVIPINSAHYKESEKFTFGIDNKLPTVPTLTQPNDNAVISAEAATFSWNSSDENLSKNFLLIFDEAGNSTVVTKDAGINNTLQITKEELGTSGIKRQWAVKSVDKAGNEVISAKRSLSIQ